MDFKQKRRLTKLLILLSILGISVITVLLLLRYSAPPNDLSIIYVSKDGSCSAHNPCFSTIQSGIASASVPTEVRITQETYNENIILGFAEVITLQGGWDATFTSCSSYTTINGSITITNGTMIIENIILE